MGSYQDQLLQDQTDVEKALTIDHGLRPKDMDFLDGLPDQVGAPGETGGQVLTERQRQWLDDILERAGL